VVSFIPRSVSQDEPVFITGTAAAAGFVDVRVRDRGGREVFFGSAPVNEAGNWELTIEAHMPRGEYEVVASARDERGAVSRSGEPRQFRVRARTVLSFGIVELGWFEIFLVMLLLACAGGGAASWFHLQSLKRRTAYRIVAARDVEKMTGLLATDVREIAQIVDAQEKMTPKAKVDAEDALRRVTETIVKMKRYLSQELSRL
jgi:hypothetical protein